METITDKTLVAWVSPANLSQRGGSALTLDNGDGCFDAIVFGERRSGVWMAGSDGFRRTLADQSASPLESVGPDAFVQVAVVYRGQRVSVYRDGLETQAYDLPAAQSFGSGSMVLLGLRHLTAMDRACFAGRIADARLYGLPLTPEQLGGLKPHLESTPAPAAWWSFAEGSTRDRMGTFAHTLLTGTAAVVDGCLVLDGSESYLLALRPAQAQALLSPATQDSRLSQVRAHRQALLRDASRPAYHFVAPEGYCMPFDPNGAIWWNGRYHLGFIFQDERGHCWGHASSADLLHWRFHEPYLAPGPGDPDRGIFSGNAFVAKDGRAVLLYHGVNAGNCIATSRDADLDTWEKPPTNPIVPSPKEGDPDFGKYRSWDPHGWRDGDTHWAIFGGNPATVFKAADLTTWQYVGPLLTHDLPGVDADEDISCPDLFTLGDRQVLLCISHKRGCRYYIGQFKDGIFDPESHQRMNWPGGTCFAPESLVDGQGRRIMWAWVLDRRPLAQIQATGWSGTMTLPRVLTLAADRTLRIEPVPELERLRGAEVAARGLALPANGEPLLWPALAGDTLELDVEFGPNAAGRQGVVVRRSPAGEEATVIYWDAARGVLGVDLQRSSLDAGSVHRTYCMYGGDDPAVSAQEAPLVLPPGESLRLRVFLDRSIIEVFANGRQCLTQHVYPTRADSTGIAFFSAGAAAQVQTLRAWRLAPTTPW
jgi:sucrose-6-phosphate hydrolase SacC (GH32 family)